MCVARDFFKISESCATFDTSFLAGFQQMAGSKLQTNTHLLVARAAVRTRQIHPLY
jgi:hypothetical protein